MNIKRTGAGGIVVAVDERLQRAIDFIPPGRWVVGVSGGSDSVALARLLAKRADLQLVIAHLNHQTRGEASDGDEEFVRDLAATMQLPIESARLSQLDSRLGNAPANPSAKYRFARFVLFRETIEKHRCEGVLLAHHRGDQIETVFQRLIRGSGFGGLRGIADRSMVYGIAVLRPLLGVDRMTLANYLRSNSQTWRVDASNDSDVYGRNRVRKLLNCYPSLGIALEDLQTQCSNLDGWVNELAPMLAPKFAAKELADLPEILARAAASRWLGDMGVPPECIEPYVVDLLLQMACDASTPSKQVFPGKIMIHRKSGWISRLD